MNHPLEFLARFQWPVSNMAHTKIHPTGHYWAGVALLLGQKAGP